MHRVVRDNYDADAFDKNTNINTEFANVWWQIIDNRNIGPYDSETGSGGPIVNFKNWDLAENKIEKLK